MTFPFTTDKKPGEPPTLEPWKQCVVDEHRELGVKISALAARLHAEPTPDAGHARELIDRGIMRAQLVFMEGYADMLVSRINLWSK